MSVPEKIEIKRRELEQLRNTPPDPAGMFCVDRFHAYRIRMLEIDIQALEGVAPWIIRNMTAQATAQVRGQKPLTDADLEHDPAERPAASSRDVAKPDETEREPAQKIMRQILEKPDRLRDFRDDESHPRICDPLLRRG
jgi:hypothetical protein